MTQNYSFYVKEHSEYVFSQGPGILVFFGGGGGVGGLGGGANHSTSTDLTAALFQDHNRRAMSHQL